MFRIVAWGSALNPSAISNSTWLDHLDRAPGSLHWISRNEKGEMIGAARLTIHHSLSETRDLLLWKNANLPVALPVADFGRLVVRSDARGHGLGSVFNKARLHAARDKGAKTCVATASDANARLLRALGFFDVDMGVPVRFDDRPGLIFAALQYNFSEGSTGEGPV